MKRFRLFLLLSLVAALFLGCAATPTSYTVLHGDAKFTVNTELGTISDELYTYLYEIDGSGSSRSVTITYPDGSTYYCTYNDSGSFGGWSDDYAPDRYADGDTLLAVLEQSAPREYTGNPFLGLLLIALGLWYVLSPHSAWYLSYGWRYKDAEPSDTALVGARISGILVILFGIFAIFKT